MLINQSNQQNMLMKEMHKKIHKDTEKFRLAEYN